MPCVCHRLLPRRPVCDHSSVLSNQRCGNLILHAERFPSCRFVQCPACAPPCDAPGSLFGVSAAVLFVGETSELSALRVSSVMYIHFERFPRRSVGFGQGVVRGRWFGGMAI